MTMPLAASTFGGKASHWVSRIAMAAVHFFILVLFLQNVAADTWSAIIGLLFAHLYSAVALILWNRIDRTAAGDTVIVAVTLEFVLVAVIFWDRASAWPWSTLFGLALVQICAFAAVRYWKDLRQAPRSAWFGLTVVLIYVMVAAMAPVIAPFGETEIVGSEYDAWTNEHLLGTDNLGRDMFTRLIYGGRNTVGVAFITTVLAFLIGGLGGLLAAAMGGWMDQVLSRLMEVLMAIPSFIFALLILTIVGTSVPSLIMVIAVLDATRVFRLARAVAMNVVVLEFVEAASLRGEGLWWIIRSEILPNVLPPLVAEFGLRFCFVFLFLSGLSFLGLGIQPPTADWGSMVRDNATLITYGDITPLLPAAAIAILTIGVNFVVDWFLHKASGLKD
jgi:peptide/nickel transport system permease protein